MISLIYVSDYNSDENLHEMLRVSQYIYSLLFTLYTNKPDLLSIWNWKWFLFIRRYCPTNTRTIMLFLDLDQLFSFFGKSVVVYVRSWVQFISHWMRKVDENTRIKSAHFVWIMLMLEAFSLSFLTFVDEFWWERAIIIMNHS